MNVVLEILIQCDTNIDHNYILSRGFALYLENYLMANVIIGIFDLCDAKIYHIKCMWVSDLQLMLH